MALELSGSINISGSMTATTIVVSSPGVAGMVSSSAQIGELVPLMQSTSSINNLTGSLITTSSNNVIAIDGLNTYTSSLKGAAIVSSSQQITNYYKFAETASANIFYNYQAISGSKLELHTSDANGGLVINSKATGLQTFITLLDRGTNDNSIVATFEDTNGSNQLGGLKIEAGRKDNQAGIILKGKNKVANSGAVNGYISSVIGNAYSDNALTTLTTGVTGKSISFLGQDTELANLNFNGDLTITNGNLVVASGKGIDFSANSNAAGMTSELLNDYEEGTFTPTLGGDSTYITQFGNYTKIGNKVFFKIFLTVNLIGTGDAQNIYGLPFTCDSTTTGYSIYVGAFQDLSSAKVFMAGRVGLSGTTIAIRSMAAAAVGVSAANVFQNGSTIELSGFYGV
jgi:hypothetical protein